MMLLAATVTLRLAELASLFGQLQGCAFPLVEALGVGPVNAAAGDTVEGVHSVAGGMPGRCPRGSR